MARPRNSPTTQWGSWHSNCGISTTTLHSSTSTCTTSSRIFPTSLSRFGDYIDGYDTIWQEAADDGHNLKNEASCRESQSISTIHFWRDSTWEGRQLHVEEISIWREWDSQTDACWRQGISGLPLQQGDTAWRQVWQGYESGRSSQILQGNTNAVARRQDRILPVRAQLRLTSQHQAHLQQGCWWDVPHLLLRVHSLQRRRWSTACQDYKEIFAAGWSTWFITRRTYGCGERHWGSEEERSWQQNSSTSAWEEEAEVRLRDPRHVLCEDFVVDDAEAKDDTAGTSFLLVWAWSSVDV